MKPIVQVPNDVLTTSAKRITTFDKKLQKLIAEMKSTLIHADNPKGVGLAATQIGVSSRVFITRPEENADIRVFINPKITDSKTTKSKKKDETLEGCLSIARVWGRVTRASHVTLSYQDESGKKYEETFTGFMATIIQHETDHINGILFTHRALEQKNPLYTNRIDKNGEEVLEEINI